MKTLLLFVLLVVMFFVQLGFGQDTVVIVEKYAGAIYTHSYSTRDRVTSKEIDARVGVGVRFPAFFGSLFTRVYYDLPDKPNAQIWVETPIVERGFSGIRLQGGYLPRLAAFIKPHPLTVENHNQTSAMRTTPGATYAFRMAVSDSVSEKNRNRTFVGLYRDEFGKLGFEAGAKLTLDSTTVGFSPFFDSQVIGAAMYYDSPLFEGFIMARTNKSWLFNDFAASLVYKDTPIGDPYVDIVYSAVEATVTTLEVGIYFSFDLPGEHESQIGIGYDSAAEEITVRIVFVW